jgi:hypothetical protein
MEIRIQRVKKNQIKSNPLYIVFFPPRKIVFFRPKKLGNVFLFSIVDSTKFSFWEGKKFQQLKNWKTKKKNTN